jgi:hypothetical protein
MARWDTIQVEGQPMRVYAWAKMLGFLERQLKGAPAPSSR